MEPPARRRGDRRDRHARRRRTVSDPRRRPADGHRTTDRERFARLVGDATGLLPDAVLDELAAVDLLVVDLPPAGREVRLAEVVASPHGSELVIHRRPVEARARSKADLVALIATVIVDQLAEHLGWDDRDLDELGWEPPAF